jgi:hypothetical protein
MALFKIYRGPEDQLN